MSTDLRARGAQDPDKTSRCCTTRGTTFGTMRGTTRATRGSIRAVRRDARRRGAARRGAAPWAAAGLAVALATLLAPAAQATQAETAAAHPASSAHLAVALPAHPQPADDPNLNQTVGGDEPVVNDRRVIDTGHVDMGPKFVNGTWEFMLRDDAHKADASAQSVWRHMKNTVLRVNDNSKLTLPNNKTYGFTGAKPGETVWVVPQTQNPRVVWAGWNTQDPDVMAKLGRGVTFSVDGVKGPGVMTVFLQNGDLGGAPEVLWDSRKKGAQTAFVDTNSHTHANWVFTKPGTYLVKMTAKATLKDQKTVTDTEYVRFSVGNSASPQAAMDATWSAGEPQDSNQGSQQAAPGQPDESDESDNAVAGPSQPARPDKSKNTGNQAPLTGPSKSISQVEIPKAKNTATTPEKTNSSDQDPLTVTLIVIIVVVALGLIALFVTLGVRGAKAKRAALSRFPGAKDGQP